MRGQLNQEHTEWQEEDCNIFYINYISIVVPPWVVLIHFARICAKEFGTMWHRQFLGLLSSAE